MCLLLGGDVCPPHRVRVLFTSRDGIVGSCVMSSSAKNRYVSRKGRKVGSRGVLRGSDDRPRLCVFRSHRYTYAQLISDVNGSVVGASSTRDAVTQGKSAQSVDSARELGQRMAEIAKQHNIESVVFDRNGYRYHGRVAAVADGARAGGLVF